MAFIQPCFIRKNSPELRKKYGKVGIDCFHDYIKEKINKMVIEKYFSN